MNVVAPVALRLNRHKLLAVMIVLRRKGAAQHVIEPVPRRERLPVGIFERQPTVAIEETPGRHLDAKIMHFDTSKKFAPVTPNSAFLPV